MQLARAFVIAVRIFEDLLVLAQLERAVARLVVEQIVEFLEEDNTSRQQQTKKMSRRTTTQHPSSTRLKPLSALWVSRDCVWLVC